MKLTRLFKFLIIPSCVIIAAAIIFMLAGNGLNLGVDFTGGTLMTFDIGADFDADRVAAIAEEAGAEGVSVSKSGDAEGQTDAVVRMKASDDTDREAEIRIAIEEGLKADYPDAKSVSVDRVGAVAGRDLVMNALTALAVAGALMLIYIWIRFELISGAIAVCVLLHDVLIMTSFMAIFNFQINSPFIAALLTIVGYAINNTIVVFDRIRENVKKVGARSASYSEIANTSVKQSLTRSINTSITTLTTILTLYIVGVTAIREFAIPIIIGLLSGLYSSVLLAGPAWGLWMDARAKRREAKKGVRKAKAR